MKILVVHEVSYLKKVIYEFQILPEALSLLGHEVTVVDLDDTPSESPGRPVFDLRPRVFSGLQRTYPRASITLRHPGTVRLPFLSRISGAVTSTLEVLGALGEAHFDALLLYGVPTVGIQALLAARRRGIPVLFRSIDVSHQIVPMRVLSPPTRLIERFVYKRADGISALTPRLKTYIASYGVPESRIRMIPGGVDVDAFCSGPRNDLLMATWGIGPSDPVILFMGTIYRFSGLDRVLRGLRELLKKHPGARLLIVGLGEDEARLKGIAQSEGVSGHVIFTGLQPYELLPDFVRSADVCINPFELNSITRDILPTKLFQYLSCAKPVLATELPGTLPFLSGEEQGVVYAPLPDFAEHLSELLDEPARREGLGRRGREAVESNYDWRRIAESMASWIQEFV